jgi:importin subunit beta-1
MHIAHLLLQHVPSILDLIQRCLKDDDRTDATMRLSYGLVGDLAAAFPRGEIKSLLLSNWIAGELRTKFKMPGETKKTLRWAREVSF